MSDSKKWLPFRFRRNDKIQARPTAVMAKTNGTEWGFTDLRRDMERTFGDLLRLPFSQFARKESWFGDHSPSEFVPTVDISDTGKEIKLTAEIPGIEKKDLDIEFQDGFLTLQGEKRIEEEAEEEGCYRTERSYGKFVRTLPLPEDIDVDKAEAKFDKGVLTVRFPKTAKVVDGKHISIA